MRYLYAVALYLLLIGGYQIAHAETIPATNATVPAKFKWKNYSYQAVISPPYTASEFTANRDAYCDTIAAAAGKPRHATAPSGSFSGGWCYLQNGTSRLDVQMYGEYYCESGTRSGSFPNSTCIGAYTCPEGYTLQGTQCFKPDNCPTYQKGVEIEQASKPAGCDCPAGTDWYPYGGCRPTCPWGANETMNAGWPYIISGDLSGLHCVDGCEAQATGEGLKYADGTYQTAMVSTKWACSAGDSPAPKLEEAKKDKEPPCGAGAGVLTSSSGNVRCVPEGVPARKPEVTKKVKKETFPDNTTKTEETITTRDPGTQAEHSATETTTTGGMSGTAGTSTSSQNSSNGTGDGDGDGKEECDPSKQFCDGPDTGGLYEGKGKTFGDVLNKFKGTLSDSPIGRVGEQWFQVTVPSGGCPAWSASVPYLDVTLNASDYFCNSTIQGALAGAGWVVLFLASFVAFRWAFL